MNPDWFDNGPLDIGAKAGIGAASAIVLLALVGCCIIWRGKRRRRAFLRNYEPGGSRMRPRAKGWPSPIHIHGMQEVSDTPVSQRPLRAWDDSPQSARSDQPFPRYVSPYSSHFGSPVSASDGQGHPPMPQWPALGITEQQMLAQMQMAQQQQQQLKQEGRRSVNIGVALGGDDSSTDYGSKSKDGTEEAYEMHRVDRSGTAAVDPFSPKTSSTPSEQSYFTRARTYSGSYRNFSGRRGSDM